jgi:hypothetical protein
MCSGLNIGAAHIDVGWGAGSESTLQEVRLLFFGPQVVLALTAMFSAFLIKPKLYV